MSDEAQLDPEIAALLAGTEASFSIDEIEKMPASTSPLSKKLFSKKDVDNHPVTNGSIHEVNLSLKEFAPLEKTKNENSSGVYDDPKYYKTVLTNENQSAQRVHQVLSKYLTCQDPKAQ